MLKDRESVRKFAKCLATLDELPRAEAANVVEMLEIVYRDEKRPQVHILTGEPANTNERWIKPYVRRVRGRSGRKRMVKVRGHWSKVVAK